MSKVIRGIIAGLIATTGAAADASYFITFGSLPAEGTITTSSYSYACTTNCPVTVTPYATFVNGLYSGMTVETLDGAFSFTGQDRYRSSYTVNFEFANGSLMWTNLTGFQELTRCLFLPCTSTISNFGATNFALEVRDQQSGVAALIAPVPEPATWAMLVLGFLAIGTALRRRPRAILPRSANPRLAPASGG